MLKKILIPIAIISFLFQIIISFFSSSQILFLNQQLLDKTQQINQLEQKKQQLQQQYSQLSSLQYIEKHYQLDKFQPIKQKLEILP
ncbi:hypothetical protein DRH14_03260 [Candidatus Shapirobacteria bacterium]|nr:MAG: hypothetical protein DRH14_03260 [Candidatus Shapirobacteria bacterium]